ncbi:MAG: hypothetical protein FWD23_16090 [Oscillospiraceae bacterium]|nr:hypothetical protein [Oscillospiraceae bacterium]
MNATNTNAMELYKNFRLPEMVDGTEFTKEDLADDMDGLKLNLQKIKIPSGGSLQFEIPSDDPENPDYTKTIEGVIIHNHSAHAFWAEDSGDEEDATPLCSSSDGKCGIGEPGGDCVTCALNRFGSGANGKGKACKNMRVLYVLRDGDVVPIQITLPPTSIKPFNDFYNMAFALRRRGACGSVVQINLKRMNNGKDDYSVATFKKVFDFEGEQLANVINYANGFKNMIRITNQEKSANALSRSDDDTPVYQGGNGNGDRVYITAPGGVINGDVDDLPA